MYIFKYALAIVFIITLYPPSPAHATTLKATHLAMFCEHYQKRNIDDTYDRNMAASCMHYIKGVLDSMIIVAKAINKDPFCKPSNITTERAIELLDVWIGSNHGTAHETTAAVALFSILVTKNPCT